MEERANELFRKDLEKNQEKVDAFYNKALDSLKNKNKKNRDLVEKLDNEEQKIRDKIEEIENRIQIIKKDKSNYINENMQNRFKSFSIEKTIYDYENDIKKLKRELEWLEKMNETEFNYIKKKSENFLEDYEKLYNEKLEIDKAIIKGVLGKDLQDFIGIVKSTQELKSENDKIFERNLKKNNA